MKDEWRVAGRSVPSEFEADLALALDGDLFDDDRDAEHAYRAALNVDRLALQATVDRLRRLTPESILIASRTFDDMSHLLTTLDIPFTSSVPRVGESCLKIVVLGCGVVDTQITSILADVAEMGVIVVTSDRMAVADGLRKMLQPRSQSARRTARVQWVRVGEGIGDADAYGNALPLHPVSLSPGHVPIDPRLNQSTSRVLVADPVTNEPLVVLLREAGCQLLHAVPHWWQADPIVDTALDRRLVRSIPAYRVLGERYPDLTWGQLNAARMMLSAFVLGLGMAMSHLPERGR